MPAVDAAGLEIGPGCPTRIMGVLNLSAASPYDPSVFEDPDAAATYVDEELIDEGADIVDVGLESANKRFDVLTAEQELDRLDRAVSVLDRVEGEAVFSIETRYAAVADAALSAGFDMVNDVCGFADPDMPAVCEAHDAAVVKMASPPDLDRPGAVEETDWKSLKSQEWAAKADHVDKVYASLERDGLTDRTIVDPAFGGWSEAQTLGDDRETFRRLGEFRALDRPILVSINRKNFLRRLAGRSTEEALPVSLAATAMAVERGADVLRTHDVAETWDAVQVADEFTRETVLAPGVRSLEVDSVRAVERHLRRVGGNPAVADDAVACAFQIDDLPPDAIAELRELAAENDLVMEGTGPVILGGTHGALSAVTPALANVSARLEPLAGALGYNGNEKTYTGGG
ncbi:MAG: dihydropteroate synthase [Halodesulfurarchaeum sp.]